MKLISMTAFVLDKQRFEEDSDTAIFKVTNYANFLNQPLTLGMFIPCDEDGNLLEKYKYFPCSLKYAKEINEYYKKYQQAKEKVLFEEVFTVKKHSENIVVYLKENSFYTTWNKSKKIEDLIYLNLTLTPNVIKKIGL